MNIFLQIYILFTGIIAGFESGFSLNFSAVPMEGLPELGEHCQRLPGVQRDRGGHEPGRFSERTPGNLTYELRATIVCFDLYISSLSFIVIIFSVLIFMLSFFLFSFSCYNFFCSHFHVIIFLFSFSCYLFSVRLVLYVCEMNDDSVWFLKSWQRKF